MTACFPVALIGAGPGDPDLLTIKAARLLGEADVVFHDALIFPGVLRLIRKEARCVLVGKRGGRVSTPQLTIHEQLIRAAREGLRVVRLKGGDPFIFGRGAEECLALQAASIPYEVVPGITSGCAAATYAGVPLTYRGLSQSVTFVTGHNAPGTKPIHWQGLARGADTLVIYMGLGNLSTVSSALMEGGRSPQTPALIVEWATVIQREIPTTLTELAATSVRERVASPAIIIIGEVVGLRDVLACHPALPGAVFERAVS